MEEFERLRLENEHLRGQVATLLVERKNLTDVIREREIQSSDETLEKIAVLVQNHNFKKRGTKIVHDAISAAGILESEVPTQPAYPMRQLEQVVYYSHPQNSQQASEPCKGAKDVFFQCLAVCRKK